MWDFKRIPRKMLRYAAICLCLSLTILSLVSCSYEEQDKEHGSMELLELEEAEFEKYIELGQYKGLTVKVGAEESRSEAVWRAIMEVSEVEEYPVSHVYYYKDQITAEYKYFAEQAGVSYEEMLAELGETEGNILEEAKTLTKSDLVYAAVVRTEGIEITAEEKQTLFDRYVEKYVSEYGYEDEYVRAEMADEIYGSMLYDKTTEFLILNNSFEETE